MVEVIPAVLTQDKTEALELIKAAEGRAKRLQVDIIDGIFADNLTILPEVLNEVETTLKLDYQLMVREPYGWIKRCQRAHATRIIGQIEMMADQAEFVAGIGDLNLDAGLALDLATPISRLDKNIFAKLAVVLVMSVPAGFGGQKFDERAFSKIRELAKVKKEFGFSFKICVDGGVTDALLPRLEAAGANEAAMGRFFKKK